MKTCFKCREMKSLSEFYTHPRMADGHLNKCKVCAKADVEARRLEKEKDPTWRIAELKRHRKKAAKFRSEGRAAKTSPRASFDWMKRNPEKRAAHHAVNNAVRDGRLTKRPCEVCGNPNSQGHHDDYSKPLEVRWLCPQHHGEHHHRENVNKILATENTTP